MLERDPEIVVVDEVGSVQDALVSARRLRPRLMVIDVEFTTSVSATTSPYGSVATVFTVNPRTKDLKKHVSRRRVDPLRGTIGEQFVP